eukprot:TRINITY_DN7109_c0_g1_i1.p1 TRINITY_DN7109_c0_g1~~TRINITY_DN7109_c0_g1_i1.p1  ORF type:complete len:756 (-),score=205.53 TRINITY_DN7109_c0_g1_i1:46-2313(-)
MQVKPALLVAVAVCLSLALVGVSGKKKNHTLTFPKKPPAVMTAGETFEFMVAGPESLDGRRVRAVLRPNVTGALGADSLTSRTLSDVGDHSQAAFTYNISRAGVYHLMVWADKNNRGKSNKIVVKSADGATTRFWIGPWAAKRVPKAAVPGDWVPRWSVRGDPGATAKVTVDLYEEGKFVQNLQNAHLGFGHRTNASVARLGGFYLPKNVTSGDYHLAIRSGSFKLWNKKTEDGKVTERLFPLFVYEKNSMNFTTKPRVSVVRRQQIPTIKVQGRDETNSRLNVTLLNPDGTQPNARLLGRKAHQLNGEAPSIAKFTGLRITRPGTYLLRFTAHNGETLDHAIKVTNKAGNSTQAKKKVDGAKQFAENDLENTTGDDGAEEFIQEDAGRSSPQIVRSSTPQPDYDSEEATGFRLPPITSDTKLLKNVHAKVSTPFAGQTSTILLSWYNTAPIPADAWIGLRLPRAFEVTGQVKATCDMLDGTLAVRIAGPYLGLERMGAHALYPAGAPLQNIRLQGIANPEHPGVTDTFKVYVISNAGKVLAVGEAPGLEVHPAQLSMGVQEEVKDASSTLIGEDVSIPGITKAQVAVAPSSDSDAEDVPPPSKDPEFCDSFCKDSCPETCRKYCPSTCPRTNMAPSHMCASRCAGNCNPSCTRFCPKECPTVQAAQPQEAQQPQQEQEREPEQPEEATATDASVDTSSAQTDDADNTDPQVHEIFLSADDQGDEDQGQHNEEQATGPACRHYLNGICIEYEVKE